MNLEVTGTKASGFIGSAEYDARTDSLLKECPACDSRAALRAMTLNSRQPHYAITCTNCGITAQGHASRENISSLRQAYRVHKRAFMSAITAWNDRANSPRAAALALQPKPE